MMSLTRRPRQSNQRPAPSELPRGRRTVECRPRHGLTASAMRSWRTLLPCCPGEERATGALWRGASHGWESSSKLSLLLRRAPTEEHERQTRLKAVGCPPPSAAHILCRRHPSRPPFTRCILSLSFLPPFLSQPTSGAAFPAFHFSLPLSPSACVRCVRVCVCVCTSALSCGFSWSRFRWDDSSAR